jgi:hypothetical protein
MSAGIANVTLLVSEDINQQNKSSPYEQKEPCSNEDSPGDNCLHRCIN